MSAKTYAKSIFAFVLSLVFAVPLLFLSCAVSVCDCAAAADSAKEIAEREASLHILPVQEIVYLPIKCFDVNEEGLIAIGAEDIAKGKNYVQILSPEGDFLYGFSFVLRGSFFLRWEPERRISIIGSRGNTAVIIASSLEICSVSPFASETEKNGLIRDLRKTVRQTKTAVYEIKNDLGVFNLISGASYARLYKTDADGEASILFDAQPKKISRLVLFLLFFVTLFSVCIFSLTKTLRKKPQGVSPSRMKTGMI